MKTDSSSGSRVACNSAGICRALIHVPNMLLLDEPFGALGAFTREEPWCILRDLWTEQRLSTSEYIFPAPLVIAYTLAEFAGPIARAALKFFWVTRVGSSRLAYWSIPRAFVTWQGIVGEGFKNFEF